MLKIVAAIKELGKKCNTSGTAPAGDKTADVIANIAKNFDITGAKGADGKDGASVTAITLYVDDGAVTGGIATLSDEKTVNITVTETPTPEE